MATGNVPQAQLAAQLMISFPFQPRLRQWCSETRHLTHISCVRPVTGVAFTGSFPATRTESLPAAWKSASVASRISQLSRDLFSSTRLSQTGGKYASQRRCHSIGGRRSENLDVSPLLRKAARPQRARCDAYLFVNENGKSKTEERIDEVADDQRDSSISA